MGKLLSIIVPTYNMEKYLHKCLRSLIVSDINMESLEVLVVNDGSKDASSRIAHEYETKYPQTFKVIDKKNGNYGSCINRGLKEITGKYVKVLDADDYFVTDVLDKFIDYLQDKDVDMVLNDFVIVDENNTITETYNFDLPTKNSFTIKDIPKEMIRWLWHHGKTYKTKILYDINYHQTEGISYTDEEWVVIPMVKVECVSYFPYILYNYLLGREGQTYNIETLKSAFGQKKAMSKYLLSYYANNEHCCTSYSKSFMVEKIKDILLGIYDFYLVKEYSYEGNELMKKFDQFIKDQSLYMYNIIEQTKNRFGGKTYIGAWRASGYNNILSLRLRQLRFKVHIWMGGKYRNLHLPDKLQRKNINLVKK